MVKSRAKGQRGGNVMKKQGKEVKNKMTSTGMPGEWLYVAPEGMDVCKIAEVIPAELETELWEEAGVLEIVTGEKQSIDIEQVRIHPKDELTREFVEAHGCKEVFLVTFPAEIYEQAKPVMQKILAEYRGLFCGDTEDFTPIMQAE